MLGRGAQDQIRLSETDSEEELLGSVLTSSGSGDGSAALLVRS